MLTPSLLAALLFAAPPAPDVPAARPDVPAARPAGGTLTGRLLYGGEPPTPDPVEVNKDAEVCGDQGLTDRSLVVGAGGDGGRGIKDVVVWLDVRSSGREPPAPAAPAAPVTLDPVTLDNDGCRFEPHVVLLRTGQELKITNSDPIAHQAAAFLNRNLPFNESVPAGGDPVTRTLDQAELVPVPITCPIHPWMKAHLLVQAHPYAAKTDAAGRFTIAGLPPGEWTFRLWQERTGFLKSDELVGAAPAGWVGSTLTVTATDGGTVDLGEVTIAPAAFE